jgi:hypothetical protein
MSGSIERQNARSQQCKHCGLYYSPQGIHNHERNCHLQDVDAMVQPMEESPTHSPRHEDDAVASTETMEVAATDGGNPALDAPDPDPAVTDGGDPSDEPECPECGGSRYFDASEHMKYQYGCADCSDGDSWVVWNE